MKNLLFSLLIAASLMSCSKENDVTAFQTGNYVVVGGDLLTIGQHVVFNSAFMYLTPDAPIHYTVDGTYLIANDFTWKYGFVAGTLLLSEGDKKALLKRE